MKLHLGAGARIEPGWFNVDLRFDGMPLIDGKILERSDGAVLLTHDMTTPLPFANRSADMIYTEHFIEHLALGQARALLYECARVLKPGAPIRISTPDLETVVNTYVAARAWRTEQVGDRHPQWPDPLARWEPVGWLPETPARMVYGALTEWGHRFCWDLFELENAMKSLGFDRVRRAKWGVTNFDGMLTEHRPDLGDLIVEAVAL